MKRASDILGLKVMGVREGGKKGYADGFVADQEQKKVEFVIVRERAGYIVSVLDVKDIINVGENCITTKSLANVKKMYENAQIIKVLERGTSPLGLEVMSDEGDTLGKVADFEMEGNGTIMEITLDSGESFARRHVLTMSEEMVIVSSSGRGDSDYTVPAMEEIYTDKEKYDAPKPAASETEKAEEADEVSAYLLGRVTTDEVTAGNGAFSIPAGTTLTMELIEQAKQNDIVELLMLNV